MAVNRRKGQQALQAWKKQHDYPEEKECRFDWPNYAEPILQDLAVVIEKLRFYQTLNEDKGLCGCFICEVMADVFEIEDILREEAKKGGVDEDVFER